jgi:transcriptional regulator with XRE-family HTH domain
MKPISTSENLKDLRDKMGFNLSELASVMQVTRPTIYEWMDNEGKKIHKNKENRINQIYEVYKEWDKTKLGYLGIYIGKTAIDNKSLLDILSCDKIDKELVSKALKSLESEIREVNKRVEEDKQFIAKHGLEEIVKKHREFVKGLYRSIR